MQCKTEDNVYHEGRSNFKLSSDSTVLMGMSAGCNSAFRMDLISWALSSHCLDVWVCRFGVLCVLTSIMSQIWWYWWWYVSSYYITLSSAGASVKPLHTFVCGHMMLMSIWSYIYIWRNLLAGFTKQGKLACGYNLADYRWLTNILLFFKQRCSQFISMSRVQPANSYAILSKVTE